MLCICNRCHAEFDIVNQKIIDEKLEVTYFTCPICGTNYIAAVINNDLKRIINNAKRLKSKKDRRQARRIVKQIGVKLRKEYIQLCIKQQNQEGNK